MNQFVPPPNRPDGQSWQGTVVGPQRGDQFTVRLDHRLNEKQDLSIYYYFNDDRTIQPLAFFEFTGANVPDFGSVVAERLQQWNIGHTWTLNPSSVNEFRFTYMREGQGQFQHPLHTNLVTDSCTSSAAKPFCFTGTSESSAVNALGSNPKFGITPALGPNREGVPFISLAGGFSIGNNLEGELPQIGNTFQWSDNFTKVAGTHTVKFGGDLRRNRFDQTLYFDVAGQYFYFGGGADDPAALNPVTGNQDFTPNYLLGLPDSFGQGSAQRENVRSTILATFIQDSWKIRPNLTLNYGLRWELDTPITDIGHRVQTFRPGQADTIFPCVLSASNALGLPAGTPCG